MQQLRRSGASQNHHQPLPMPIMGLAKRVRDGEVLLPKFQREFVWTRTQVLDLLDSIARNYPIGSLLLWDSSQHLASDQTIADLEISPRQPDDRVSYLLDGRQRLSTICGALYWQPNGDSRSFWNIAYDLREQRFLHLDALTDPPLHHVPVRLLPDPSAFFRRLITLDDPKLTEVGDQLFNRFQGYAVAVVTLEDMAIKEIGRIFERVNTRGTPLTTVEFIRAATWGPDFDLLDAIDSISDVLARKRYGQIDRTILLRAITAATGLGFSIKDIEQLPGLTVQQLKDAIAATEQAARSAVDFLTTQIKTPNAASLPYMNQFAVVVEIFRQVPKPTAKQYGAIRRWFWQTMLSGYFRGWNSSQMLTDQKAVNDFAAGRATYIRVPATPPGAAVWLETQYRRDSAMTKALALVLASAEPLDLRTGQDIDIGKALAWSNDMEYHHFFPKAWLTRRSVAGDRANVLANIIMLTSISNKAVSDDAPSAYLQAEIDFNDELAIRRRLETCLIPPTAFDAAMADDYETFLAARAELLVQWTADLISGQPPRSMTPPRQVDGNLAGDEPIDQDTAD